MSDQHTQPDPAGAATGEHADLIGALRRHRDFLLFTVREVSDEQARQRTTVSELTLGGLIKHVAQTEKSWADFIVKGPEEQPTIDWEQIDWSNPPEEVQGFLDSHRLREEETLEATLTEYRAIALDTDRLIAGLGDLDAAQPLPEAPWFEPGATWTARRTILHILAETAQHAGHADIIREALDGQKTMG